MTSKHLIPRLLAGRGRLSRVEKESILENVLAEVSPRRSRRRWLLLGAPALAAAVVALLVLLPRGSREPAPELAPRGGGAVTAFEPTCPGSPAPSGCRVGDKLLFDVHGTSGYRYFAAFSKRPDGTVVWYFPAPDGSSLDLSAHQRAGVIDQGIVLGAEHPAGRYEIYGVFSQTPLTRQTIREQFDEAGQHAGPDTKVVARELVVR